MRPLFLLFLIKYMARPSFDIAIRASALSRNAVDSVVGPEEGQRFCCARLLMKNSPVEE